MKRANNTRPGAGRPDRFTDGGLKTSVLSQNRGPLQSFGSYAASTNSCPGTGDRTTKPSPPDRRHQINIHDRGLGRMLTALLG
jgi:hypothetical protein